MISPVEEEKEVQTLAKQVLQSDGLFLLDVELKGSQGNRMVWIYVESEKGNISLDKCAEINRELSLLLDASGWHGRKYTLNVSSPGLDRPLKDIRQYVNNLGRKASVVYLDNGREVRVEGKLTNVQQDLITLVTEKNDRLEISFSDVLETRILVSFK